MSTRLYLSKYPGKPVTPSTSWNEAPSGYISYGLYPYMGDRSTLGSDTVTVTRTVATNPMNMLVGQFVSGRLSAQTISGTVKGQQKLNESNVSADYMAQIIIRLVNPDLSHKSVLLAPYASTLASELSTTNTNRKNPYGGSVALTSQSVASGDRLVVEIGIRAYSTGLYNASLAFIASSLTDLPEDESTTTNYNPWVEFSGTISFLDEFPPGGESELILSAPPNRTNTPMFEQGGSEPNPTEGQLWPRGVV